MESTTVYLQAKPVPAADPGDGADLISGLADNVLLRIVGLLPDARQVVRTGALSRRWRGLWMRVSALRFDSGPRFQSPSDAERFIAIVNHVIAPRAQPGIEQLGISMNVHYEPGEPHLAAATVEAIERWVLYAVQHELTSFAFAVRVIEKNWLEDNDDHEDEVAVEEEDNYYNGDKSDDEEEDEDEEEEDEEEEEYNYNIDEGNDEKETPVTVIALDELPSSTKLETLHLFLGGARVQLPSTSAIFPSLTDLSLKVIAVDNDHLSRFLSPACCPCLQKLCLWAVRFDQASSKGLVLETSTLLELTMYSVDGMESLELRATNLRALDVECCDQLEQLTMSASRLEQLTFSHNSSLDLEDGIQLDLPCVRRLQIGLVSHMLYDCDINDTSISLLKSCSSATCLVVDLEVPWVCVTLFRLSYRIVISGSI
ncbi:unnamed protein product [Urochloa decumbens]|uniref:F-box/LRR-repeat protein 15/At3g58940/PEG3-like LRR domain-containing protein n=1 Tax=Urochloa decumbens TaxID=240449 RepID=A0ABC8Y5I4_9POAL